MRERMSASEVMAATRSNMQKVFQVVQMVAARSCTRALELFCCPLYKRLTEQIACCPAQTHQVTEDKTAQVGLQSQPSTILIVNISNSTLVHCVIGNDNYPSAVQESQPLMQEPGLPMDDEMKCSYSHGQQETARTAPAPLPPPLCSPPPEEPPSITIQNSHLNCVIIGDNNYMSAEEIPTHEALALQS